MKRCIPKRLPVSALIFAIGITLIISPRSQPQVEYRVLSADSGTRMRVASAGSYEAK